MTKAKVTIDMPVERMRVEVSKRIRQLENVRPQYLSNDEREELRKCRDWQRRNPVAWEGGR